MEVRPERSQVAARIELLAMTGTGAFGSVPEACRATITETESLIPGPGAHTYRERYRLFNEIYPALKPIYGRL
jgi:sugar (pentulose or hexulose) kinase